MVVLIKVANRANVIRQDRSLKRATKSLASVSANLECLANAVTLAKLGTLAFPTMDATVRFYLILNRKIMKMFKIFFKIAIATRLVLKRTASAILQLESAFVGNM